MHLNKWSADKPQVQIKLSIQRLRTLQEKRLALAKKSRREIADLLVKGRLETSRLRVEGLIQDDIYVELLELLEVRHTYDRDSCG
jgi:vacuolar protein sorting-associated protein IST1